MQTQHSHHDVIIVGARCAGASTALLLARLGYDVALVDRATFPSDTPSTHAIARGGVVQLQRWGLLDAVLAAGTSAIRSVSFHSAGTAITRPVKDSAGVDHLMAPRRHVLDALLVEAAVMAGATLHVASTVTRLLRTVDGRVSGVSLRHSDGTDATLTGRLVVGADGVRSRLAREMRAPAVVAKTSPSGTFYTYVQGLDADGFEFHVSERALAGVFPTTEDEACVWISAPAADSRPLLSAGADKTSALVGQIEAAAPELGRRIRRSVVTARVRGAVNLPHVVRHPFGPGWALVGDAGYHRDPITGHGITDAFRDAEFLARAVDRWLSGEASEAGALDGYREQRDHAIGSILDLTWALTQFPGVSRFVGLQKQLSEALEVEATLLAGQPALRKAGDLVPA